MNENLNIIMQKLSDCMRNYSSSQIVGELSLVVERLGFAEFQADEPDSMLKNIAKIDFLLDKDVSPGTIEFVKFLTENGKLGVLLRDAGLMFIGFCKSYYSEMKQLSFRTAVEMSPNKQQQVRMTLMSVYPVNTRILFESDPTLVAGFALQDSNGIVCDYSLRNRVLKLINEFIRNRMPLPWNQTKA